MEISQLSIKNSFATAKPISKFGLCETKPPVLKQSAMFTIGFWYPLELTHFSIFSTHTEMSHTRYQYDLAGNAAPCSKITSARTDPDLQRHTKEIRFIFTPIRPHALPEQHLGNLRHRSLRHQDCDLSRVTLYASLAWKVCGPTHFLRLNYPKQARLQPLPLSCFTEAGDLR